MLAVPDGVQLPLLGDPWDTRAPRSDRPRVLDLFAGLGGFSLGFTWAGFEVTGVDVRPESAEVFVLNGIGSTITVDLAHSCVLSDAPVLIGGPPCRPWSTVNQGTRARGVRHRDYWLLSAFFRDVVRMRPSIFVMENVPPVKGDAVYGHWLARLGREGYDVSARRVSYATFGAATTRSRLITVGVLGTFTGANEFFRRLAAHMQPPRSVGEAIGWLCGHESDEGIDHVWPSLRTISRYRTRYDTRAYGWYQLTANHPAPSFGNVLKTYILPPPSLSGGVERVLSVREVLSIMGFEPTFRLPTGLPLGRKYQMVADTVSPCLSRACAVVVRDMLWGGT